MYYSQKEIIEALQLIKAICIESSQCEECPFRSNEDFCSIMNEEPCGWKINSSEKWTAFL